MLTGKQKDFYDQRPITSIQFFKLVKAESMIISSSKLVRRLKYVN